MRKFLQIFGAVALCIFALLVVGGIVLAHNTRKILLSGQRFIDSAVPAIATNWDQKIFETDAAPELVRKLSPDELSNFFFQLSLIGPMQHYDGAKSQQFYIGTSKSAVDYIAKAKCKNANIVIYIEIIRRSGQWEIDGFHVNRAA